jgi:hypothetical protein
MLHNRPALKDQIKIHTIDKSIQISSNKGSTPTYVPTTEVLGRHISSCSYPLLRRPVT